MATFEAYLKTHKDVGMFKPLPYYSVDGDSLIFFFKDEDHFAERCDERLTVYRSFETKKIVGCQIKGVNCILKKLGNFGFEIKEGDVKLTLIFLGYAATRKQSQHSDKQDNVDTVAALSRAAAKANATIPAKQLVPA